MKRTVFVVGAGASADFGLPLGSTLVDQIRTQVRAEFISALTLGSEGPLRRAASSMGTSSRWRAAADHLYAGLLGALSIDQFLHAHREDFDVQTLGKMAIVARILEGERQCQFGAVASGDIEQAADAAKALSRTWIGELYLRTCRGRAPKELYKAFDNLAFVTFNYDRCIEFFLCHLLRVVGRVRAEEASEIVRSIPIYHAYGTLGRLPEMATDGAVAFGAGSIDCGIVAQAVRTFREEAALSASEVPQIREEVARAESGVFLGFGYGPENLSLLAPDGWPTNATLHGTMLGFEQGRLPDHLKKLKAHNGREKDGIFNSAESLVFLRAFGDTLFEDIAIAGS